MSNAARSVSAEGRNMSYITILYFGERLIC